MGFQAYSTELLGHVPKLPIELARKQINRAWEAIRRKRLWSFLIQETLVLFPDSVSAGTVTVTFGSTTIVGDATATAAWGAVLLGTPPLTSRQFRYGNVIYNITAVSTTVLPNDTLTLDMPIGSSTLVGASYSIYVAYVPAPSVDFKRWKSTVDPQQGFSLARHVPRQYLDLIDPQRSTNGQALRIADYKTQSTGRQIFEWWPHQTAQCFFHAMYETRGTDFSDDADALPVQIPESLLIDYALAYFTYPWANANQNRFPELKGTSWLTLAVDTKKNIDRTFVEVRRDDEEAVQQQITLFANRQIFPVDAAFWQQHSLWDYWNG